MSIAGGIGAAVRLPTPDARFGVEVQAARSPGRTRFRRGAYASTALTDLATVTRATQSWGVDQGGNVAAVAAGQPVVNTAGLAVYEARTNSIRNPTGLGAVAGTPGTLPTNWGEQIASGLSRQVVGAGTENGRPFVDVRLYGTTVAAANTILFFEASTIIAAANAQVWTGDLGLAVVAGSQANVSVFAHRAELRDSGGGFLVSDAYGSLNPTGARAQMRAAYTISNASAAYIRPGLSLYHAAAAAVDITLRIYAPNLKLGADIADPPILQTNNAAATRNADVIVEPVNIPVGQDFTIVGKLLSAPATGAAAGYPWVMSLVDVAPSYRNRLSMFFGSGGLALAATSAAGANSTGGAAGSFTALAPIGFAISISGGVAQVSYNGGAPSSVTIPGGAFDAAFTKLFLGCSEAGTQQLNSAIRELSISMRAFSAAELQAASDITLTHDIDFVSQVYRYVGAPYVTPTDLPGTTFSRASGGYADDGAGALVWFASGVLRITARGVLFEPQSANLYPRAAPTAAQLSTNIGATDTAEPASPPISGLNWLALNNSSSSASAYQSFTTVPDATVVTFSVLVETTDGSQPVAVNAIGAASGDFVPIVKGSVLTSASIAYKRLSGNVWRVEVTGTSTTSATGNNGIVRYNTQNTRGLKFSGFQIEVGGAATSLIVTTGASATRPADVLASANDSSPAAYTVVAEFTVPATAQVAYTWVWGWDDGTGNNRVMLVLNRSNMNLRLQIDTGGVSQAYIDLGTLVAGQTYKVAAGLAANDVAVSINGAAVAVDTSVTLPAVTAFRYGRGGGGNEWCGFIRRVQRYTGRKTNSELQALAA